MLVPAEHAGKDRTHLFDQSDVRRADGLDAERETCVSLEADDGKVGLLYGPAVAEQIVQGALEISLRLAVLLAKERDVGRFDLFRFARHAPTFPRSGFWLARLVGVVLHPAHAVDDHVDEDDPAQRE